MHKSEWTPPQRTPNTACGSNANRFILSKTHTLLTGSIFSNQWPPTSSAVTHHVQSVLTNMELIMSYNLWLKHYSLDVHLMTQCGKFGPNKNLLNTRRQSGRFSSNKISYLVHLRVNNFQALSKCLLETHTSLHCFFGPVKAIKNITSQQSLCLCYQNNKNFSFVQYYKYPILHIHTHLQTLFLNWCVPVHIHQQN
jgi:hypothetical protein